MKKIIIFINCILSLVIGITIISCKKQENKELLNNKNEEIQNDTKILNELIINVRKQIYNKLADNEAIIEINNSNLFKNIDQINNIKINNGIEKDIMDQKINLVCRNINREIINNYSNYYLDNQPIEIQYNLSEIIINYINPEVYNIYNKINVDTKNVKAVNANYNLYINLKYKKIKNTVKINLFFIITNNKNFITNKISEYINFLKEEIQIFNQEKNKKILIDNHQVNNDLKIIYNQFNLFNNYNIIENINKIIKNEFKLFLEQQLKKNKHNLFIEFNSNIKLLEPKENVDEERELSNIFVYQKRKTEKKYLKDNHLANWLFNHDKTIKNNSIDFINFYYNKNNDFQIKSFVYNLNCFSISKLPLISGILENEELTIYLTNQGLKYKIQEFGNLIYQFLNYFHIQLNNEDNTILYIDNQIFNNIKNNIILNQEINIIEILNDEFKNKNNHLNNIKMFNFEYIIKQFWTKIKFNISNTYQVDNNNQQIIIGNKEKKSDEWGVGFTYAGDNYYQFNYVPFGNDYEKSFIYIKNIQFLL